MQILKPRRRHIGYSRSLQIGRYDLRTTISDLGLQRRLDHLAARLRNRDDDRHCRLAAGRQLQQRLGRLVPASAGANPYKQHVGGDWALVR